MLWSLKSLVENQMKNLAQNFGGSRNPPFLSAADERTKAYTLTSIFQSLENGGNRRVAAAGWVADQDFPEENAAPSSASEPQEELARRCEEFFGEMGITKTIDWNREISQKTLEQFSRDSLRQAKSETLAQDAKTNRLVHLMLLALGSGNISFAMLLFSQLETNSANEVTRCLMGKVQALQDNRRKLTQDLQNQKNDAEGSKNMQKINADMQQTNDDISVLQTFIRDIAQSKQASIELANAFISKEHETTMAIVRSFGR